MPRVPLRRMDAAARRPDEQRCRERLRETELFRTLDAAVAHGDAVAAPARRRWSPRRLSGRAQAQIEMLSPDSFLPAQGHPRTTFRRAVD